MAKNANKGYTIDFQKGIITISKSWEKKASIVESDEYNTNLKLRQDYPTFKIVYKTTKHKGQHNKITIEFMENYMNNMLSADCKKQALAEYETLKEVYKFPKIKAWFIAKFPNYNEMIIADKPLSLNNFEDKTDKKENKAS
jgi:hypothetical protein